MLTQVYSVSVGPFFGAAAPSDGQALRGDVSISFSCDPEAARRLVDMALSELERLQVCWQPWCSYLEMVNEGMP